MLIATLDTVISAPAATVFDYVSDIDRLPEWAVEFAPRLVKAGDRRKVVNAEGEFFVEFESHRATGVIDMLVGADSKALGRLPTRVVELTSSETLFSFTMVAPPDATPEAFEASKLSLTRELAGLKQRLESSAA